MSLAGKFCSYVSLFYWVETDKSYANVQLQTSMTRCIADHSMLAKHQLRIFDAASCASAGPIQRELMLGTAATSTVVLAECQYTAVLKSERVHHLSWKVVTVCLVNCRGLRSAVLQAMPYG